MADFADAGPISWFSGYESGKQSQLGQSLVVNASFCQNFSENPCVHATNRR
jgi:hypothetical protein